MRSSSSHDSGRALAFLDINNRAAKPRTRGITVVRDLRHAGCFPLTVEGSVIAVSARLA
jgi:hypothetical protein